MKCSTCEQEIIIHPSLFNNDEDGTLITMLNLETRGMIYSQSGLRHYSETGECENCQDCKLLDDKSLKSYRLRVIKQSEEYNKIPDLYQQSLTNDF